MLNRVVLIVLLLPSFALADSLLYKEKDIALHRTKKTSYNFVLSEQLPNQDQLPELIKGASIPVPGYLFSLSSLPDGAGDYDGLPLCNENRVRHLPRSENEDSFLTLDILVYQFDDRQQKLKAAGAGYKAVPYIEGALSNPYRPDGDTAQTIIRTLAIECLPTRVKAVEKNGQKAFEYREGRSAWGKEAEK